MREKVIAAHAELPTLCEHIHLPLQSGSSRILKAMRRTYDRERYMERVAMIRDDVPDCAITTDIIVGFPGETEAGLQRDARGRGRGRLRLRLHVRLLAAPGHGGRATSPDQLPHAVKRERMERLVELVQRRALERSSRFVGTDAGGAGRGPEPHRPRAAARPHAPQQDRQLHRPRAAGELVAGRDHGRDLDDARRRGGPVSRTCLSLSIAIFGPTGVGKTEVAGRAGGPPARAGERPRRGVGGRDPGLRGPRHARRQAVARRAGRASSTG